MQTRFNMFKKKKTKGSNGLQINFLNLYPIGFLFRLKEKGNGLKERRDG